MVQYGPAQRIYDLQPSNSIPGEQLHERTSWSTPLPKTVMNKSQGSHLMVDQNKCAVFGHVLTLHLVLFAALVRHRLPLSLCVLVTRTGNSRQFSDCGLDDITRAAGSENLHRP